jgi:hypothetical protein
MGHYTLGHVWASQPATSSVVASHCDVYDHLPIILDMNLLRSVGGIQRAVIGWIDGHEAPYK